MMDVLTAGNDAALWFMGEKKLFIAAAMVAFCYFVLRKREEFSLNAIQNTAATVLVYGMNIIAMLAFYMEINVVAQTAYASLGIPTLPPDFWSGSWVWVGMAVAVVAKDFSDYIIHRLMHTRWIWPTHAAHHSDTHVNAFTTFRVHFLEAVLMLFSAIIVMTWLQLPHLLPLLALLLVVHNMYVHIDVDWDHGPLKYLIASPRFHRWHHADVPEAHGKNLANLMPLFDLMFGTYRVPGVCREKMGALASGIEDKNPVLIWVYPFQEWARLVSVVLRRLPRRTVVDRRDYAPPPAE